MGGMFSGPASGGGGGFPVGTTFTNSGVENTLAVVDYDLEITTNNTSFILSRGTDSIVMSAGNSIAINTTSDLAVNALAGMLLSGGGAPFPISSDDDLLIAADGDLVLTPSNSVVLEMGAGLIINGESGTAGDILVSSGAGDAPVWETPSGGAPSEPANQVVYGTGTGVDSHANFTYDPAGNVVITCPGVISLTGTTRVDITTPQVIATGASGWQWGKAGGQYESAYITYPSGTTKFNINDINGNLALTSAGVITQTGGNIALVGTQCRLWTILGSQGIIAIAAPAGEIGLQFVGQNNLEIQSGIGTGTASVSFATANKPGASNVTSPATWIPIMINGSKRWIPAFAD